MKYRIIKMGDKYYPQYYSWWCWHYFLASDDCHVCCESLEKAEEWIEYEKSLENKKIVKEL